MDWNGRSKIEDDIERIARRLEQMFFYVNDKLLEAAGISREQLIPRLAEVQGQILGFDEFMQKNFLEALEERRVRTLSGTSIFASCVLCSAVALSQFKRQPLNLSSRWARQLSMLQRRSTNPASLLLLSAASFSTLFGKQGAKRVEGYLRNRPLKLPK